MPVVMEGEDFKLYLNSDPQLSLVDSELSESESFGSCCAASYLNLAATPPGVPSFSATL